MLASIFGAGAEACTGSSGDARCPGAGPSIIAAAIAAARAGAPDGMSPAAAKLAAMTSRKIACNITRDLLSHLRYTVAPSKTWFRESRSARGGALRRYL